MSDSKRVKIALIGAGNWGLEHARIFAARPDIDFCAVMGRTESKTRARAKQFGTRYYLTVEEMLKKERPDLVSISLPNQEHFEPTMQVIKAGYPLLVEKPLVFRLDEADQLLYESARRNLFFAINFNWRYARPTQMAREAIQSGRLGDIVFATWRFGGEGTSDHPYANLIETQCHAFDQLEFLCGPIDSIMAQMTDKTGGGYRTLVLALHFANGAVGSLVGTYDSSYAYPDTHRLEINGTNGRIVIGDTVQRYMFQSTGSETGEVWQSGFFNDRDREFHRTFDRHMDEMFEAFKHHQLPPIHAAAGRRALELAVAAIESFESGRRISVPS